MKYALAGFVGLILSHHPLGSTITDDTGAQAAASEMTRKPVIVELFTS